MDALNMALNAARWEMVKSLHNDGDYVGVHSFIGEVVKAEEKQNVEDYNYKGALGGMIIKGVL